MTREEAIERLKWVDPHNLEEKDLEAVDTAIEALSQPIVAKHFDIQSGYIYCSPQDAENVKVVVRCKDCRKTIVRPDGEIYCKEFDREEMSQYGYCNWGERKGGDSE